MNKNYTYAEKHAGDPLTHTEWNNLAQDVDAAVNAINNGGVGGGGSSVVTVTDSTPSGGDATVDVAIASGNLTVGSPNVIQLTKKKKGVNTTIVSGNNVNIEPRESVGSTKGGNISLKPGDDIELCSHHRVGDNQREVSVKAMNGSKLSFDGTTEIDEYPVDLQLNAANITLTTKDKATYISDINAERASQSEDPTNDAANVMNITVNSAKNTRGYLKVRAQAIDLRCEEHGGIALQPKGNDGDGNENKIKFEHGGGDGLEFGTFNTKKTSIFTDEYRFNKTGVWKMASRFTEPSDKADLSDSTTANKYLKNNAVNNSAKALATGKTFESADDFYDFVDVTDIQCTTLDIIKTASAMNSHGASTTNNGNLDIECTDGGIFVPISTTSTTILEFTIADSNVALAIEFPAVGEYAKGSEIAEVFSAFEDQETVIDTINAASNDDVIEIRINDTPKCKFKVCNGNITLNSTYGKLKFRGELDFGKSFNFGETEDGILIQKKYTKKGSEKSCDILKVYAINNNASPHNFNSIWDNSLNLYVAEQSVSVASGASQIIAQCSMYDIIKAVCWMKANNQGPWAS